MFNFNLQNRAFEELNAEQFRIIYFLNNTLSMVNEKHNTPDNNKIEMFNGYMMNKLGLCERQVQRLIKGLEKLGYINVERTIGRNAAKKPNIITLNVAENNDINDAIYCALYENSAKNSDINADINVTLNKKNIKIKENNNNTSTITSGTRTRRKKEKINKKEIEIGTMDKGSTNERSNGLFYDSLDNEVNGVSDNGTNGMNAMYKCNEMELGDSSTVDTGTTGHTSSTEVKNEIKDNTSTGAFIETDPTPKENNKPQNGIKIYPPSPQEEIEHKRASILKCIESGKKFMYETTKTKDLNEWKAQMEYITIQFNNLKKITPTDAYNGVRKDFKRWWDATKQYFPKGWNEKEQTQQPQKKKLLTKIKESDQQVLQYWIDSTDDNKDEMISRLLSKWEDVYEPDTIAQIYQKSHLNASCASETADVGNYPIQHVKTQQDARKCPKIEYNELEEESGVELLNDATVAQIIYINQKQSQYRIN